MWSGSINRALLWALVALVAPSCGDDDEMTMTPDAEAPTVDSGGPGDAGVPSARWELESNLTVNGVRLDESIRSAVAQHYAYESGPGLTIALTTASDYCALVQSDGCLADGEVVLRLDVYGTEPGAYTLSSSVEPTPGTFSLIHQTIDRDCTGAGFGPTEGTLTLDAIDGGALSITFDTTLSFVGASSRVAGTVTAPFCD